MILIRALYHNKLSDGSFLHLFQNGGLQGHVDLPRIQHGGLGGAFWSAYIGCPKNWTDFSNENYSPIVRATLEQIDLFQRLSTEYPALFTVPRTIDDAVSSFQKDGTLISPIAVEGLHQIGNSAATLRLYRNLGVKYSTLTWNCHNKYADAALTMKVNGGIDVAVPLWKGLSKAGEKMVLEMNRIGMIVDLSHVSKDTMIHALIGTDSGTFNGSLAPPIFSHSSAYAVCPHPRNVPDDVLHLVKKRNSLVMVNVAPDFIACKPAETPTTLPEPDPENATLQQIVKHIVHIGELIGYDHVGIGTDFDGIGTVPVGFEDVSKFPNLVAELLNQGLTKNNVIKIIGGNLLRVWREVDKVSKSLEGHEPLEDDI
jgi:membrane dipeptidase